MKNYLSVLRVKEIVGKTGFFLVGVIFSNPAITVENLILLAHFSLICLFNGVTIYLINAVFGYEADKKNKRLVLTQGYSKSTLALLAVVLFMISITWLYFFSSKLLVPALVTYMVWVAYSVPGGLKGIPFTGLLIAFIGQIFHFHLGYLVFAAWSNQSVLLSIYFSLLFMAGHALHEVIDYEADKASGFRTTAVYVGKRRVLIISTYLFAASVCWLIALAGLKILPVWTGIPYWAACLVQGWFLLKLPHDPDEQQLFAYRKKYMTAYLAATCVVMMIIFL